MGSRPQLPNRKPSTSDGVSSLPCFPISRGRSDATADPSRLEPAGIDSAAQVAVLDLSVRSAAVPPTESARFPVQGGSRSLPSSPHAQDGGHRVGAMVALSRTCGPLGSAGRPKRESVGRLSLPRGSVTPFRGSGPEDRARLRQQAHSEAYGIFRYPESPARPATRKAGGAALVRRVSTARSVAGRRRSAVDAVLGSYG